MTDFKHHMYRHLRSARQWLTRAEEAFDKDSDIQGELNLFLAQAELQQLQEVKRSRSRRCKYLLLRHGLAVCLAVTVTAVGMGGYWWINHRQEAGTPVPLAQESNMPARPADREQAEKAMPKETAPLNTVQAVTRETAQGVTVQKSSVVSVRQEEQLRQTDKELLPSDEKQKLIRAAGKSLRGQ